MQDVKKTLLGAVVLLIAYISATCAEISISKRDTTLIVGESDTFSIKITENITETVTLHLIPQHSDIIQVSPDSIVITPKDGEVDEEWQFCISTLIAGHSDLTVNATPADILKTSEIFVRVTVQKNEVLEYVSTTIGWIYFVAWSVSFYPQIYMNFKRKSVVGLNFDFLCLNIVGFVLYSLFNCGLYFIPEIKDQYSDRYPRGLNPVQENDIVFALHATFATLVTIAQCFIYERDNQRVSWIAQGILGIFGLFLIISIIIKLCDVILWLDFLIYCSYVKLSITLIKYIPQAYMNYKRKSTIGWSIGNILLDFTGGVLSMLQMILNAYNYNDWISIFSDLTKFGLGFFSVVFDVFFILQHYVFYRYRYIEIPGSSIPQT